METTNILITGANGQLGHEMRNVLAGDSRFNAVYTDVAGDDIVTLDITDETAVERMVADNAINVIVNCAAYTAVDAAEDNEQLAALLNASNSRKVTPGQARFAIHTHKELLLGYFGLGGDTVAIEFQ